ncbi:MAG TPA: hypothetical protein VGO16_03950 [Pseudonocardiaceae bacterium]|jgi:hypothetical protein|nr:hypothetical protein [Pseudonocardiaceae bacterium]
MCAGHAFVQNLRRGHYELATDVQGTMLLVDLPIKAGSRQSGIPATQQGKWPLTVKTHHRRSTTLAQGWLAPLQEATPATTRSTT